MFLSKLRETKKEELESKNIKKAISILKAGGIVIFPTDTVYGIGCRQDDKKAILRLYNIKGTPGTQPFPILISDPKDANVFAEINPVAQKLMRKYWPGALTIILKDKDSSKKIGLRVPKSELIKRLIHETGAAIVGTSANFHGFKTPTSFEKLDPEFVKLADLTIKGQCQTGIESTVIDATVDPPKILRKGAITLIH